VNDKYLLIAAEEGNHSIALMCRLLRVDRTGYHRWHADRGAGIDPGSRRARRTRLGAVIMGMWLASRKAHGVRRIHADLAAVGEPASRWLVWKIMCELGIAGVQPRARKRTTIPADDAAHRKDLIRRRFRPPEPTTHLVGDITYLNTGEGWLYLATVIDLTTRMVVGWATAAHMQTPLISEALINAHRHGYVAGGAVFHSDRGAQYTSAEFASVAALVDVRLSVGRTGVCWDNAVAESFFSMLKNEMYHRERFATRARARLAVADYIEVFYNRKRRHSTLGYQTPHQVMTAFFTRTHPAANQAA